MIQQVQHIVRKYKAAQTKYLQKHSSEQDPSIKKGYESSTNMLNFLPTQALQNAKPAPIWTRKHDIDLIFGTFDYGFANYDKMLQD